MLSARPFFRCTILSLVLLILIVAVPGTNARAIASGFTREEVEALRLSGRNEVVVAHSLHSVPAPSYLHPESHARNQKTRSNTIFDYLSPYIPSSAHRLTSSHDDEDFEIVPYQMNAKVDRLHQEHVLQAAEKDMRFLPQNRYLSGFLKGRRGNGAYMEELERELEERTEKLRPKWIAGG